MSFWGRLFGTEKAIDNIVDKDNGLLSQFGGWVGKMQFTEQERAEHDTQVRDWGIRQLDALSPFKVTQRILALTTAAVWVFMVVNIVVAMWLQASEVLNMLIQFATSQYVAWPTISVFALYFTGGVVDSWKRKQGAVGK